ncbi:uncharacterized protein LOC128243987 [Mya arenaria]|uniref:uncharacterized protein LOC128243987 n=1 Tax=Mya arenaria TaxID=6604 RepID=UPI0022E93E92|nr:uncharacterized protein LOC128243987 [Mya arenaria]
MTKSHALHNTSTLPTTMRDLSKEEVSTDHCADHPGEFIKYFCPTHQALNCGHCSILEHQSCKQQIISEIAKAFKDGTGYEAIKDVLVQLLNDIDTCLFEVEDNIKLVEKLCKSEMSKLSEYRDKVNKYFNEREKALLNSVTKMQNMDERLLNTIKPNCHNLKSQVIEIKTKLEAQENNDSQLFIEAHKAKNMLDGLKSTLAKLNKEKVIHQYQFRKDPSTESLLASITGLGTFEILDDAKAIDHGCEQTSSTTQDKDTNNSSDAATEQAVGGILAAQTPKVEANTPEVNAIPVRSPSDSSDCCLASMLLLPGDRLLLSDGHNDNVKLVDLKSSSLVSQITLPGWPCGMCLLPEDRVAVGFRSGSISFLDTQGQISLAKSIKVDVECRGVGYYNDSIIVLYLSGNMEKRNMKGKLLKMVSNQFEYACNLTVVSEGERAFIYVSDYCKHTITKLDMDLNILKTFQDPALRSPMGTTAVGNKLLICGVQSNNIMCLDLPSGQMTQLLGEKNRLMAPRCVCYKKQQNKLFITCCTYLVTDLDDYVKVFHTA